MENAAWIDWIGNNGACRKAHTRRRAHLAGNGPHRHVSLGYRSRDSNFLQKETAATGESLLERSSFTRSLTRMYQGTDSRIREQTQFANNLVGSLRTVPSVKRKLIVATVSSPMQPGHVAA